VTAKVAILEEFRRSMRQEMWVYSLPRPKAPDTVKVEVETKGTELISTALQPERVV